MLIASEEAGFWSVTAGQSSRMYLLHKAWDQWGSFVGPVIIMREIRKTYFSIYSLNLQPRTSNHQTMLRYSSRAEALVAPRGVLAEMFSPEIPND